MNEHAGTLGARLRLPLTLVVGVVAAGTGGYYWLWRDIGGTWLDALFMTVTTITTVGYGEVKPLDAAGRIFTMVIAVVGVANDATNMYIVLSARVLNPGLHIVS